MHIVAFIYLITTFGSIFTAFPQIKQLRKMKNSDEFNIFSWTAWSIGQVTALIYSITIHSIPFIIVNIGWVTYYVIIMSLIFKYRKGSNIVLVPEKVEVNA